MPDVKSLPPANHQYTCRPKVLSSSIAFDVSLGIDTTFFSQVFALDTVYGLQQCLSLSSTSSITWVPVLLLLIQKAIVKFSAPELPLLNICKFWPSKKVMNLLLSPDAKLVSAVVTSIL